MTSLGATTDAILRAAPGAWACAIMGFDGLTVEARTCPSCPPGALDWVVLLSAPLAALRRAGEAPKETAGEARRAPAGAGPWDDLVVSLSACHLVASALGEAHFAALLVGPQGLSGQGRHVLRQHRAALMSALFPPTALPHLPPRG